MFEYDHDGDFVNVELPLTNGDDLAPVGSGR